MGTGLVENSLVQRQHTSIPMRVGARLAGTKLTLFAGLGATGGTTNCQRFLLRGLHGSIMPRRPPAKMVNIDHNAYREHKFRRAPRSGETCILMGKHSLTRATHCANFSTRDAPYNTLPCGGRVTIRESARPRSFRSHKSRSLYFAAVIPRSFHSY